MFYDHDPSNTCSTWTYLYYSPEFSSFEALGFDLVPFGHKPPQLELLGEFTTGCSSFQSGWIGLCSSYSSSLGHGKIDLCSLSLLEEGKRVERPDKSLPLSISSTPIYFLTSSNRSELVFRAYLTNFMR